MKQKLFQFAILFHPNENEMKEGKKSEVLVEPKTILATDQAAALLAAARQIPESHDSKLDQIEIAMRPF